MSGHLPDDLDAGAGAVDGSWALPEGWVWMRLDQIAAINFKRASRGDLCAVAGKLSKRFHSRECR
jgi:hypothetical protein